MKTITLTRKKILIIGLISIIVIPFIILLLTLIYGTKPNPEYQVKYDPPVRYKEKDSKKMLDSVENKYQFSPQDKQIRDSLTTGESIVNQTETYTLEYVAAADEFMVEIRSTDIDSTKTDATNWLISKGLSRAAICHLPLVFYLNGQTGEQLRDQNLEFSPLPPGC